MHSSVVISSVLAWILLILFFCRYKLLSKNAIEIIHLGSHTYNLQTPVAVKQGYFPGFHFDHHDVTPPIPESSTGEGLFETVYNSFHDDSINTNVVITATNNKRATYSFAAHFTTGEEAPPGNPPDINSGVYYSVQSYSILFHFIPHCAETGPSLDFEFCRLDVIYAP